MLHPPWWQQQEAVGAERRGETSFSTLALSFPLLLPRDLLGSGDLAPMPQPTAVSRPGARGQLVSPRVTVSLCQPPTCIPTALEHFAASPNLRLKLLKRSPQLTPANIMPCPLHHI